MSPIPERCPFREGDRVRRHAYHGQPWYPLLVGTVRASLGATVLSIEEDGTGRHLAVSWGSLTLDGEPDRDTVVTCTCCPPVRFKQLDLLAGVS